MLANFATFRKFTGMDNELRIIGLTGGIASGKSVVAEILKKNQIYVIDADDLARRVAQKNTFGFDKIVERFGKKFLAKNGEIDRAKLAELIFNDSNARTDLENITHPLIAEELQKEIQQQSDTGARLVVYMAPLIFEKKLDRLFYKTILIATNPHIQLQRLMKRNGLSKNEAQSRIDAQMPLDEKIKRADIIIDNNGSVKQTAEQLRRAWQTLTGQALN